MRRDGVFSDLDLNAGAPARVQPKVGVWGPAGVPATRQKRRWRWLVYVLFVVVLLAVLGLGYYAYLQLVGGGG